MEGWSHDWLQAAEDATMKRRPRKPRPKIPSDWPDPKTLPMCMWRGLREPEYIIAKQWQVCEGCGKIIEEGEFCVQQAMPERYLFACCPKCHLPASQRFDEVVMQRTPITQSDIAAMF